MKDLRLVLPLSLQGIDIGFDGRRGLGGGSRGRGLGLGRANGLGTRVSSGGGVSGVVTFVGTVALLPAAEAKSFLGASRSLRRSKF